MLEQHERSRDPIHMKNPGPPSNKKPSSSQSVSSKTTAIEQPTFSIILLLSPLILLSLLPFFISFCIWLCQK